jgi:hypothetical protein
MACGWRAAGDVFDTFGVGHPRADSDARQPTSGAGKSRAAVAGRTRQEGQAGTEEILLGEERILLAAEEILLAAEEILLAAEEILPEVEEILLGAEGSLWEEEEESRLEAGWEARRPACRKAVVVERRPKLFP